MNVGGNRTRRTVNGVIEYYGYKPNHPDRLEWVRQGTNSKPSSGNALPYTLFTYDTVGRPLRRDRRYSTTTQPQILDFTWDGDDRLRTVAPHMAAPIFEARYDSGGLRTYKSDFSGVHNYSWGLEGLLHDSDENSLNAPGIGQQQAGLTEYFHGDWLGTTRYTTDQASAGTSLHRYDAFGQRSYTLGGLFPTEFGFGGLQGYQTEPFTAGDPGLGLQYLEQRYYDPAIGRFLTPDPIGWAGGLNLYAYCENDPVNCVDPSGLTSTFRSYEELRRARRHERGQQMLRDVDQMTYGMPPGPAGILGRAPAVLKGLRGLVSRWGSKIPWPRLATCRRGSVALAPAVRRGPLPRGVQIHGVNPDWAVKGAHITIDGIELAVRPGEAGGIVFKPVFSNANAGAVAAAIKRAQELLNNPGFVDRLLERVRGAKPYVRNFPREGGVGRSGELHFLEAALERLAGRR